MTDEQLLVDTSDLVHIDNTETINGLKYFSRDTVIKNLSPMTTNCITYIPQDIKLELNNGTLTIKAGSKVYVPNGFEQDGTTPKYQIHLFDIDIVLDTYVNANRAMCVNTNNNTIFGQNISQEFYSGPNAPSGYTYMVWYDTTNNLIKYTSNSGSSWVSNISLPFAIISGDNGTGKWNSIDQVFNGFGYIGSTLFALPGVKGLIPNGRNEDGSLKNIEFVTNKVSLNYHSDGTTPYVLFLNQNGFTADHVYYCCKTEKPVTISPDNYAWYNPKTNIILNPIGQEISGCYCISAYRTDGKITSFMSRDTFNILDYGNKSTVSSWSMPSNRYIDLTLGVSGTVYIAPANGYVAIRQYFASESNTNFIGIYTVDSGGVDIMQSRPAASDAATYMPIKKGCRFKVHYTTLASNTASYFRFIYAEGDV